VDRGKIPRLVRLRWRRRERNQPGSHARRHLPLLVYRGDRLFVLALLCRLHGSAILPAGDTIKVPTGYAQFPREILKPPRTAAARVFTDIRRWSIMPKGGHFAALEQPELLAGEVRAFFRELR